MLNEGLSKGKNHLIKSHIIGGTDYEYGEEGIDEKG